ncbi:right-handed parallel beta-helix repeat-containing protein [Halomonas sp. TRM85114]|uniref:glycosyl hydrolase family 28-related protein n=1 Tax=Halomonas jincaotanensis TaxID=2810616 RepID=UPI001BD4F20C|nr:glycosyl hydrolase family 28-related protein [Halomonas jincaotanensis]MBS9404047.1 right-handed parallel beta-helix repeat-containing protein [Halomonas jincaotanensis]
MKTEASGRREFIFRAAAVGTALSVPLGVDAAYSQGTVRKSGGHAVMVLASLRELKRYRGELAEGQLITAQGSLFEWRGGSLAALGPVSVEAFGARGDGNTDDTRAILEAVEVANTHYKSVYFPAGHYLCTERIAVRSGAFGDGAEHTLIRARNRGRQDYNFFHITGSGVYEGFTVDGAVSRDPGRWTIDNYDAFTGWNAIGISADDVVIRNCVARNSWNANLRCELANRVTIDNVEAIRSRGEMGDGFYIQRSHHVKLTNCRASDHTRIGFVCEGGASGDGFDEIADHVSFIGCQAHYGHDQGVNNGGREFNTGFWFENASQVTCSNCTALDQEEAGFICVGSSRVLSEDVGRATVQFTFTDCYARNTSRGFQGSGLEPEALGHVSFTGCVSDGNDQGFVCQSINARLSNCSYYHVGGGSQSRAVSTGREAVVAIDHFYECWQDRPAAVHDPEQDPGSVSTFSSESPRSVTVRHYRTQDGSPAVIKYRVPGENTIQLSIDDTLFSSPRLMAHCTLSNARLSGAGRILSIRAHDSEFVDLRGEINEIVVNNCRFSRTDDASPLLMIHSRHDSAEPCFFMTNCRFIGDLEQGAEFIRVDSGAEVADIPRAHDIYLTGCLFYNTGSETDRVGVELTRAPESSKVLVAGGWKSPSIRTLTGCSEQLVGAMHELA